MEGRPSGAQGWRCSRRRVTSRARSGAYFASAGEDMRGRIGAPIIDGHVGCIVIRPDRTREPPRAVPDRLARPKPDWWRPVPGIQLAHSRRARP